MSGFNVPLSDITNIVTAVGYPVITDRYRRQPLFYPRISEVVTVDPVTGAGTSDGLLGHREGDFVGGNASEVEYGQGLQAFSAGNGYPRQMKGRKFGGALKFPRETFATPQSQATIGGRIERFVASTTTSIIRLKEQLVADVYQKGTIATATAATSAIFDQSFEGATFSTGGLAYDSKPFFAASGNGHPIKLGSSTYINLTVLQALNSTNVQTVQTTMQSTNGVDERGNRILVMPNVLLVPPGLEHSAKVIVNSALVPGSANNDVNTLQGMFEVVSNPYLTDVSDAWWLLDTMLNPVKVMDSGEPRIVVWEEDGGQNICVGVYAYFGAAPWDWRGAYCSNKATS
jgi:hypothetical protein